MGSKGKWKTEAMMGRRWGKDEIGGKVLTEDCRNERESGEENTYRRLARRVREWRRVEEKRRDGERVRLIFSGLPAAKMCLPRMSRHVTQGKKCDIQVN